MGQTTKRVAFDFHPAKGKAAKSAKKQRKAFLAGVDDKTKKAKRTLVLPKPQFAEAGRPGPSQGRGCSVFKKKGLATTAHTAATAYPYVAGPSLGHEGAMIGHDLHGGGAFCFDPWELYAAMSMEYKAWEEGAPSLTPMMMWHPNVQAMLMRLREMVAEHSAEIKKPARMRPERSQGRRCQAWTSQI